MYMQEIQRNSNMVGLPCMNVHVTISDMTINPINYDKQFPTDIMLVKQLFYITLKPKI